MSRPVRRGLIAGLLAVWAAASLMCCMSAEPRYTADPALEGFGSLYRLLVYTARSFFSGDPEAGACLALCVGILMWFLPALRSTGLERGLAGSFGVLFAFFQLLGLSYSENQSWSALFGSRFACLRGAVCLGGRVLLAGCLALYAFRLLDLFSRCPVPARRPFSWKRFLLAAGLVALCWIPYYWAFYPGLSNPDTGMQIAWALHKPTEWLQYSALRGPDVCATNHHPYFVTLVFGIFARLGLALGDISRGVALYCLLQLLLTALVMSAAWYYLRRLGLSEGAFRGGLAFTALFPLFPLYAVTMLKDSLFSLSCLGFSLLLFETARTKGEALRQRRFLALLFFAALLVALTKNQGVYFVATAGAACLPFCRLRLRAAGALLVPALLFQAVWLQILLPAWNVAPGGKQEVLGPLFQQTARYVSAYPGDVTEEEAEAIRAVIDYDRLPELYNPRLADPVKFTYRQDATEEQLSAYCRAWLQMFRKHPAVYVEALLNNVYGGFFVRHETALSYTNFDNRETAPYPELCVTHSPQQRAAEAAARILLPTAQHIPGLGLLFCVGFYPWVILFVFLDVLRRRQFPQLLAQLPAVLSVAVLIAAPVSGSYRYAMPMIYMLPFLLASRTLPGECGGAAEEIPPLLAQVLRFTLAGGLCFLIDYGLLALLVEAAGWPALAASAVSFSVSVAVNYLLSVRFVFRRREGLDRRREMAVFLLMSVFGLGLNQALMLAGTQFLNIHYLIVKPAATLLVMVYNFVTRKAFLEKKRG